MNVVVTSCGWLTRAGALVGHGEEIWMGSAARRRDEAGGDDDEGQT